MDRRDVLRLLGAGLTVTTIGATEVLSADAAFAAGTRVRKSIFALNQSEVNRLTAAFNAIKSSGTYDKFVRMHQSGMNGTNMAIHMGPAFLPWHRAFLLEMEDELRKVDPSVTIPYWPWGESSTADFKAWAKKYFGGDGDSHKGYRVLTGPFANWKCVEYNSGFSIRRNVGIVRQFGDSASTLPTRAEINAVLSMSVYDTAQWDMESEGSFRNSLEGWTNSRGRQDDSSHMHNQVHLWVGGDMLVGTSPNDPLFWLNHSNVDRLWAAWQQRHPNSGYLPVRGVRQGQNLNDKMRFLQKSWTPVSVLNSSALGVTYA